MTAIESKSDLDLMRDTMRQGFAVRQISAEAASEDWRVRDGALQHRSGGFFAVCGYRDPRDKTEHLLLYQPQGAINGLATAILGDKRWFLLQARAEPGNMNLVQYGPSLQTTPANWMRVHGGASAPFSWVFLYHALGVRNIAETMQLDLGSRYLQKTKRVAISELKDPHRIHPGFHWVSPTVVIDALAEDYYFNTDLRAALALAPWSVRPTSGELCPRSECVRRSLKAPLRPEVVGRLLAHFQTFDRTRMEPVPLDTMQNWEITSDGIVERQPKQQLSVGFFEVQAMAREVTTWIQPLVVGQAEGRVALACREQDDLTEVWVTVRPELGHLNGVALCPSILSYPGDQLETLGWLVDATTWMTTRESDEGGRFLNHCSLYELVRPAKGSEPPAEPTGAWLRVSELKHLIGLSNVCSIQLRTISSLLLCAP